MVARLLEFGLRWPDEEEIPDWEALIAAVESEPLDGPLHRAKNPKTWFWYVPGYHEQVMSNELAAVANWQRGGGKGQRPKPAKRPWDKQKQERVVTGQKVPYEKFQKWYKARFSE